MSIILPKGLPIIDTLLSQGYEVWSDIPPGKTPLRVLFLNIMPQKEVTELDFANMLGASPFCVQLLFMKISGQTYKTTPIEHMNAFYRDFEMFESGFYDGLIVTGAPVEHLDFEEVRYWHQLQHIFDWAATHVRSTLYVCWGAQAGLYHRYGIPKYRLPAKLFGVFPMYQLRRDIPIFNGIKNPFPMPNSRHTEVRRSDFPSDGGLEVVAESAEAGIGLAVSDEGRSVYVMGHMEYEPYTLDREYRRDLGKGLPIAAPLNYYCEGTVSDKVDYSWRDAAFRFYANWLYHYVASSPSSVK